MADYSDPLGLLFGGANYFGSPQKSQGLLQITPQEIERMAAAQSPAFGVFPQMQPYRSQQDITASANVPVDVARGRVAGTLGLFGDVFNQPIPMVRPLQLLSQAMTGQQKYPDTEYFLDNLPLKSDTPVGNVAGRVGSFAPINPMPAVRGAQKLGGLLGEEVATRLSTGRPILPSLLAEPQTAMFAVNPAEQAMTSGLLQAEVSPLGFYSAVEQQALKIPRKQGTGESFLNDLLKGQDVKKYEIEAMGLDTYLKGKPNVTRQEVQDFIANNRVDVQEVRYGSLTPEDQAQKELLNNRYRQLTDQIETAKLRYEEGGIPYSELRKTMSDISKERTGIEESLSAFQGEAPKFGQYQLAGGENYRELLLTLPEKTPKTLPEGYSLQSMADGNFTLVSPDNIGTIIYAKSKDDAMEEAIRRFTRKEEPYRSSHFKDPNILAHMRVNDRVDAEGKKMLLIEEVQSDWHQAGRERGYGPKIERIVEAYYETKDGQRVPIGYGRTKEEAEANIDVGWKNTVDIKYETSDRKVGEGVPDAPFKDTWYQLALKRAIKEAVDKGYDRIGLTTGKQQAARYDLSKQVDEIAVPMVDADGSRSVRIDPTDGTSIKLMVDSKGVVTGYGAGSTQFSGKKLDEVIGKEIAEKVMNAEANAKFSGFDLQVGGEGMKKYYDEIYPNFLNKYGKKYGAQVGETKVNTIKERAENSMIPASKQETVRYLDITPEMKKAVQKGQPLAAVEGMTGLLA
jgi:hypothetical protein